MKILLVFAFAIALGATGLAQDTASVVVKQGDPVTPAPTQITDAMLKDMIVIGSEQLPENVRQAVDDAAYRGTKTFYKHKEKEEYGIKIKDGEVTRFHFFDKDGQPINK